jgi:hypothetical protein
MNICTRIEGQAPGWRRVSMTTSGASTQPSRPMSVISTMPSLTTSFQEPHLPLRTIESVSRAFPSLEIVKTESTEALRVVLGVDLGGLRDVVADVVVAAALRGEAALPLRLSFPS